MATSSFDTIIIGLGAIGSAAACHLARAGSKVLGLDRYHPPHAFGSSHGQTRIIREAYFEHPAYVPLVQRAYQLWMELEKQTGRRLFTITGGLMIGPRDGTVFSGALRSATEHNLEHEILSGTQVQSRYPALTPGEGEGAVFEPRAGILCPEACIEAHLLMAQRGGAELHWDEEVRSWDVEHGRVRVSTAQGSYTGRQLLVCAGAWITELLGDLHLPLRVERQVQFWFRPQRNTPAFGPSRCPIYIWEFEPGRFFYGFPDLGKGVKVAMHHEGATAHPDRLDRQVTEKEIERMREVLAQRLPDANGPLESTAVCMYTDAPDGHFLIGRHPSFPLVLIASPCSGHGFKFSSALGEVLSDLILKGRTQFDLELFRIERFA